LPGADAHVLAVCGYNRRTVPATIVRDNMTGVPFHFEKSGPVGLTILWNFIEVF
jgi:imidazoleglycerol phosphate synthase glutamine amidotransferase subunit HisH